MGMGKRHEVILKRLKKDGTLRSQDLLTATGVSKETLRKDLKLLEAAGALRRMHGKVVFAETRKNLKLLQTSGILTPDERREQIIQLVKTRRKCRISNIPKHFNVSLSTIQKDLMVLEKEGFVEKRHGYVMYTQKHTFSLIPADFPKSVKVPGDLALSHIDEHTIIFLDGSLCSQYMAAHLSADSGTSVISTSLKVLQILSEKNYPHSVLIPEGTLYPDNGSISPQRFEEFLEKHHVHTCFFSFSSFFDQTLFIDSNHSLRLFNTLLKHSGKTYCFLDSKTIGVRHGTSVPSRILKQAVEAIIVDDGIELDRAYEVFPLDLPIIIAGEDFTHHYISDKNYKIGFSLVSRDNYFTRAVRNSIEEAARKVHNISLITRKAHGDLSTMMENMNWFIQEKINLLIDYSLDFESSLYVAETCRSYGIKVLSIDNHIPNSVYYGAMNYKAGMIAGGKAAEGILDRWDGRLDTIIVIKNETADPLNELRVSSTLEAVKSRISINPDRIFTIRWVSDAFEARETLRLLLEEEPARNNCLIIQFNNVTMVESHETIRQFRDKRHTMVVSHNYSPQIEELMKEPNSPIFGSVCYSPMHYGEDVINLAVRMLKGEQVGNINYTRHRWIPNSSY